MKDNNNRYNMRFIHQQIVSCSFDMLHTCNTHKTHKRRNRNVYFIKINSIIWSFVLESRYRHHAFFKRSVLKGKTNHFKNNIFTWKKVVYRLATVRRGTCYIWTLWYIKFYIFPRFLLKKMRFSVGNIIQIEWK